MKHIVHAITFASDHPDFSEKKAKILTDSLNDILLNSKISREVYLGRADLSYRQVDGQGLVYPSGNFDILVSIKASSGRGGWASIDSSGTAGINLRWKRDEPIDIDILFYFLVHEFGHCFGCGESEVYHTNIIKADPNIPEDPGVNSMEFRTDDYWNTKQDWFHDPMRSNEMPFRFSKLHSHMISEGTFRKEFPWMPVEILGCNHATVYGSLKEAEQISFHAIDVFTLDGKDFMSSGKNTWRVVRTKPRIQVFYISLFDLQEAVLFGDCKIVLPDDAGIQGLEMAKDHLIVTTTEKNMILEHKFFCRGSWKPINAYPYPGVYKQHLRYVGLNYASEFFRLTSFYGEAPEPLPNTPPLP